MTLLEKKLKKCPVNIPGIKKKFKKSNQKYFNSLYSQRERILKYFESCPRLSTMQARSKLGILHPCGRIMELRRLGYRIDTVWVCAPDDNGIDHRIGMYVFHGFDWSTLEARIKNERGLKNITLDERYALLKKEIAKRHLTKDQYELAIKSLGEFLNY